MNDSLIHFLAASYIGPFGHGNDRTGLRAWPVPLVGAFERGVLAELHWSLLFGSDPGRFGRMDLMSRLGLMAVEMLDAGFEAKSSLQRDQLGVCLETCAGCLSTDCSFLQTPRASLFAYTLPSTVLGEICIRHRLRGPVMCLVTVPGAGSVALVEAADWLLRGQTEACLCVGVEAVEFTSAHLLPLEARPDEWHGCALLLGKERPVQGAPLGQVPVVRGEEGPVTLSGLCRQLCRGPNRA